MRKVTIVDYGMGNIWSVRSALQYLELDPIITGNPEEVLDADILLLPGVGSFRIAMETLRQTGLDRAILNAVNVHGAKILGICLGMQLMGSHGSEGGETSGLGMIPQRVDKFTSSEVEGRKIPHVGFNDVVSPSDSLLFKGLPRRADFYFTHSYRMLGERLPGVKSTSEYGVAFLSAYEHQNIFATQFHPEKSQTNGLKLIKNFLSIE